MEDFLKIAGGHLKAFRWFKIEQVLRAENAEADSLVRITSKLEDGTLGQVPIEILAEPSTKNLPTTSYSSIPF